jgi:hypothetical protein
MHQTLARHPKTLRLASRLGVSTPAAVGHLALLWWWALDYAPKGDLSGFTAQEIASACDWSGDPGTLYEALKTPIPNGTAWIDEDGRLHDWMEYAGRLVKQREADKKRKKMSRRILVEESMAEWEDVPTEKIPEAVKRALQVSGNFLPAVGTVTAAWKSVEIELGKGSRKTMAETREYIDWLKKAEDKKAPPESAAFRVFPPESAAFRVFPPESAESFWVFFLSCSERR